MVDVELSEMVGVVKVDVLVVVGLVTTLHVLLSTTFLTSGRLEKFHA